VTVLGTATTAGALLVTAAGLVAAAGALARTRHVGLALAVLLDFLTAAALLHLAGPGSWQKIGAAALTIVIRQLATRALAAARAARRR
jgi:hypothetical protein